MKGPIGVPGILAGGSALAIVFACAGYSLGGIIVGAVGGSVIGWSIFEGRLGGPTFGFALGLSLGSFANLAVTDPSPRVADSLSSSIFATVFILAMSMPPAILGMVIGYLMDRPVRLSLTPPSKTVTEVATALGAKKVHTKAGDVAGSPGEQRQAEPADGPQGPAGSKNMFSG